MDWYYSFGVFCKSKDIRYRGGDKLSRQTPLTLGGHERKASHETCLKSIRQKNLQRKRESAKALRSVLGDLVPLEVLLELVGLLALCAVVGTLVGVCLHVVAEVELVGEPPLAYGTFENGVGLVRKVFLQKKHRQWR